MYVVRYFKEALVSFRIFLSALCLSVSAVHASEAQPDAAGDGTVKAPVTETHAPRMPANAEERDQMAARAKALDAESEQRQAEANRIHEAAKTECWKKFLVSSCLDEARLIFRKESAQASRLEREARSLDKQVRKYDAAQRKAERDADNARRDAEMEAKAEKYRAKQAAEEGKRAD